MWLKSSDLQLFRTYGKETSIRTRFVEQWWIHVRGAVRTHRIHLDVGRDCLWLNCLKMANYWEVHSANLKAMWHYALQSTLGKGWCSTIQMVLSCHGHGIIGHDISTVVINCTVRWQGGLKVRLMIRKGLKVIKRSLRPWVVGSSNDWLNVPPFQRRQNMIHRLLLVSWDRVGGAERPVQICTGSLEINALTSHLWTRI